MGTFNCTLLSVLKQLFVEPAAWDVISLFVCSVVAVAVVVVVVVVAVVPFRFVRGTYHCLRVCVGGGRTQICIFVFAPGGRPFINTSSSSPSRHSKPKKHISDQNKAKHMPAELSP